VNTVASLRAFSFWNLAQSSWCSSIRSIAPTVEKSKSTDLPNQLLSSRHSDLSLFCFKIVVTLKPPSTPPSPRHLRRFSTCPYFVILSGRAFRLKNAQSLSRACPQFDPTSRAELPSATQLKRVRFSLLSRAGLQLESSLSLGSAAPRLRQIAAVLCFQAQKEAWIVFREKL
jgi:hypothetical protein